MEQFKNLDKKKANLENLYRDLNNENCELQDLKISMEKELCELRAQNVILKNKFTVLSKKDALNGVDADKNSLFNKIKDMSIKVDN